MVCDKGERSGRDRERDTESKTRTPHKDVGKNKNKKTGRKKRKKNNPKIGWRTYITTGRVYFFFPGSAYLIARGLLMAPRHYIIAFETVTSYWDNYK